VGYDARISDAVLAGDYGRRRIALEVEIVVDVEAAAAVDGLVNLATAALACERRSPEKSFFSVHGGACMQHSCRPKSKARVDFTARGLRPMSET